MTINNTLFIFKKEEEKEETTVKKSSMQWYSQSAKSVLRVAS